MPTTFTMSHSRFSSWTSSSQPHTPPHSASPPRTPSPILTRPRPRHPDSAAAICRRMRCDASDIISSQSELIKEQARFIAHQADMIKDLNVKIEVLERQGKTNSFILKRRLKRLKEAERSSSPLWIDVKKEKNQEGQEKNSKGEQEEEEAVKTGNSWVDLDEKMVFCEAPPNTAVPPIERVSTEEKERTIAVSKSEVDYLALPAAPPRVRKNSYSWPSAPPNTAIPTEISRDPKDPFRTPSPLANMAHAPEPAELVHALDIIPSTTPRTLKIQVPPTPPPPRPTRRTSLEPYETGWISSPSPSTTATPKSSRAWPWSAHKRSSSISTSRLISTPVTVLNSDGTIKSTLTIAEPIRRPSLKLEPASPPLSPSISPLSLYSPSPVAQYGKPQSLTMRRRVEKGSMAVELPPLRAKGRPMEVEIPPVRGDGTGKKGLFEEIREIPVEVERTMKMRRGSMGVL